MFEFKFADIGEGIHEGTILKWNFKVGDKVKEGETLVVVETDKVNAELPSPVDGIITSLGAKEGEEIHVGQIIVTIDDGSAPAKVEAPKVEEVKAPVAKEVPSQAQASGNVYDFKFADIGEGIHEGTILKWNFKEGDKVNEGETLVVVETDKVNAELPAPETGVILKIGKKEGEVIHVGETVVLIGLNGATLTEAPKVTKEPQSEPKKGAGVVGEIEVSDEIIGGSTEETLVVKTGKVLASPVARKLASDLGVDIATVKGTGEQGRVLKDDLANLGQAKQEVKAEVKQEVKVEASKETTMPAAAKPQGDVEVVKISRLRKAVSNAMTRSKSIIPETVLMDEINVNELVKFRNEAKTLAESKGIKLTYMAFIAKAVLIALKEFPTFNASFNHDTDELYIKKYINLGMAVDTPDGLIVPNLKNADKLSVFELASGIRKLADDTIARKITLDQQTNGTFTITNFGSAGIAFGTPVINYPELAILGIGKIEKKPWVIDDEIKIAYTLPLSLAVDHRIIDGADGGRFLMRVKELLSNPTLLLLS
ncbi:Dihydrolipoyllysine-residue acetyltransferase component of pyruvate dehydrogenase complex [Acholeplasma oculi]|uniref:Dihydrolipoamide acetyltransferase component of pyruvate dehydrogenase complex n=1 Tax=Acholeplasma oculi TaxID=35623 RepID=A0A061A8D6_9MOLU|nr:2-oxo acid dehydrogenase subunit E2 [Acholeplasma oculi]CDR30165.1 Dihydrolipoamide acetyltransferase component of pyruvate dehydrogenase complex [Acholeplasma oculi]SKC44352.1 pyruvate dehydrogenase E2 component (dihydrolipoamide acetyltransferase) [Acholeplasma oculi]SUT88496.1 Dihydrolipoyllysine-residue acetyltransferase component of pyruvate dehydrogenase complex [Acholeplasma oculi]